MTESQSSSGAQGAKEQVQEKAQEAAGEARTRLRDQVDQRSTQAGEQIGATAQALRSTADRLREEGQDAPARAAQQLATHAEKAGSWLRDADADTILGDVEEFARRQPLAVVGIGLFAGFAASRFLKASSRDRYASRSAGGGTQRRALEQPRYGGQPPLPTGGTQRDAPAPPVTPPATPPVPSPASAHLGAS
jgi:ElaB/YqjD/DUF883 family membrane-anchored ribosome-binding protein